MAIEFKHKQTQKQRMIESSKLSALAKPSESLKNYVKGIEEEYQRNKTILQKHEERLAYNAAYQRDLRKIKKLGLDCTVKEYRKQKETGE